MKKILILLIAASIASCSIAQIDLDKIKKQGEKVLKDATKGTALSNDEVVRGLREALNIGSTNASNLGSKVDAYYKNTQLFIPFPAEAQKVATKLREIGLGKKVDQFVLTLNRAAEEAAKEAAPIFLTAVKGMTITDGINIVKGADNAATTYLQKNTNEPLKIQFKPVITRALAKTNATKYWSELITTYNKVPGVTKMNPDLAGYTTQRAINGLFVLISAEELKIRKDPAARVTDILKKVFGNG